MTPEPVDVISTEPRTFSPRASWVMAVGVLLVAALAGAITMAVHYRVAVASLHRQLRSVSASHRVSAVPLTLSSSMVALPSYGALHGAATIFSARSSGGLTQILLSAHISGGRPHTGYTLIGFDCAGSTGYETWGAGVTDGNGTANLSGQALTVSMRDTYWLYLSTASSGTAVGRGLRGSFTAAGKFSTFPAGNPACP